MSGQPAVKNALLFFKIACGIVLAFFAVKMLVYHYNFIVYPFPNEYREGAMMTTTDAFLRGVNPFELNNQPQYMNDYGVLYPLVVYPFAKLFGATLLVHRLVTAFFIFACMGVMFRVMRRRKADLFLTGVALQIFYASSLYPTTTTPMANPSSLGLFIFLLALLVPWARGFSFPSLLLSAGLGVLAYYAKPYFLACVPLLAIYLFLFVSKRKSILFFAVFSFLAYVSVLFVHRQWNCYFANCFFLHTNPGWLSWGQSVRQLGDFILLHRVVIGASGIVLTAQAFLSRGNWLRIVRERQAFSFILYCTIMCSLILVFWLGKHEEAYLWYYFHLVSPWLLICMAVALSRQLPWTVVFFPFLLWNCWLVGKMHETVVFDRQDKNWLQVEQMIAAHKDILNSPVIAPLLVQHHRPVYDNGLSEYFKKGGYRDNALVKKFSKGDPRIILRYYKFMNEMREKIKRHDFDLVLIVRDYAPLVPGELLQYYRMVGVIDLKTPGIQGNWPLTVWVPNDR